MNPADEMVPKRETTQRQLEGAAAGPFDSLKDQLRAVFKEFESPSHQSKPVEDLHGSDDRLDEPLPTTLKDFRRPALSGSLRRRMSPWRGMTFVWGSLLTLTTRLRNARQIMIFQ